jgi:hypothetical protein
MKKKSHSHFKQAPRSEMRPGPDRGVTANEQGISSLGSWLLVL